MQYDPYQYQPFEYNSYPHNPLQHINPLPATGETTEYDPLNLTSNTGNSAARMIIGFNPEAPDISKIPFDELDLDTINFDECEYPIYPRDVFGDGPRLCKEFPFQTFIETKPPFRTLVLCPRHAYDNSFYHNLKKPPNVRSVRVAMVRDIYEAMLRKYHSLPPKPEENLNFDFLPEELQHLAELEFNEQLQREFRQNALKVNWFDPDKLDEGPKPPEG